LVDFCKVLLYNEHVFSLLGAILRGREEAKVMTQAELVLVLVNLLIEEKLKNKKTEDTKDEVN